MLMRKVLFAVAGMIVLAQAATSSAAVITSDVVQQSDFTVSSTDLINQGGPSLASESNTAFTSYAGSSIQTLNDGTSGGYNINPTATAVDITEPSFSVTYMLNLTNAPHGYDLNTINVLSTWNVDYLNQRYAINYSTVADPDNFTASLGTFEFDQSQFTDGAAILSTLTDSTGTLATNVAGIEFTSLQDSVYGHLAAYREVDVLGAPTAAVPEPAMAGLGAAIVMLLASRRRRQATLALI
jgi:hypothetical protein